MIVRQRKGRSTADTGARLSGFSVPVAGPAQRRPAGRSGQCGRVKAQPEAVGQPREVVEHANHVGDFEAALIVETNLAQGRPVLRADRVGIDAELLSDGTERAPAVG